MRVGIGFDVHQLKPHRPLVLGGIQIPFELGLDGHSDADVILHAVMDAMLGALALGDIGKHFPNSDERFRGADSQELLRHVWSLVTSKGYELGNLDVMVMCERPKLQPYIDSMRERIANLTESEIDEVSIKATTMETMGFVGREEGIAAQAVVLLSQRR